MLMDITVLLDRSGSMQTGKEDHEGGLKSFIEDQQNKDGETRFTFIQFDSNDPFEVVLDNVNINDVDLSKIRLVPRGSTPLLDAVGKTIAHVQERVDKTNPDQTVVMIITDGMENSSTEWRKDQIKEAISKRDNDWKFLFLGANQDSFSEARGFGLKAASAMNYEASQPQSVKNMYDGIKGSAKRMRSGLAAGFSKSEVLTCGNFVAKEYVSQQSFVDNTKGLEGVEDGTVSSSSSSETDSKS